MNRGIGQTLQVSNSYGYFDPPHWTANGILNAHSSVRLDTETRTPLAMNCPATQQRLM